MTRTVLLPGNSAGNRASIDEMQKVIGGEALHYLHWDTGAPMIDFEREVQRLAEFVGEDRINVLAKSAGTLLAMRAMREAGLQIEKAVFLGTAVNWGAERGIPVRQWLQEWRVPTLFVHKEYDPVISTAELSTILNEHHSMLVLPGSDHDYFELDKFIPQVRAMLA